MYFIVNLSVMALSTRPVNSSVRHQGDLNMKFGRSVLLPSYTRIPDYKNFDYLDRWWTIWSRLRNYFNRQFNFRCINCHNLMAVEYELLISETFGWEQHIGKELAAEAKEFYRIGISNNSPDGGWPSMAKVECRKCKVEYLIYAGVNEVHNSAYLVTMQGITEMIEGDNSTDG